MPKNVTIGARVSVGLDRDISKLAVALGRSKSWVIEQALENYVGSERQFVEAVNQGLADIEAGRTMTHEQVVGRIDALLKPKRR
jgi:predicted transcriptional regulator